MKIRPHPELEGMKGWREGGSGGRVQQPLSQKRGVTGQRQSSLIFFVQATYALQLALKKM